MLTIIVVSRVGFAGGLGGVRFPPLRVLTPRNMLLKKLDPPLLLKRKKWGGSGFWHRRLDIGEMNAVCACGK